MEIIAKVLYGSQNYGLDTPESDMDFKLIVRPDFDDLYYGRNLNEKRATPASYDPDHYSTMDVRQWFELLKKGNVNAIEYLFSSDFEYRSDTLAELAKEARSIYLLGYVFNVWSTFFASTQGVALNAIKRNGISRKTVARAYYYRNLIDYVAYCNGSINERSWRNEYTQELAHEIRFNDVYGENVVKDTTEESLAVTFNKMKAHYDATIPARANPNLIDMMDKLQKKVYNYVKGEILKYES